MANSTEPSSSISFTSSSILSKSPIAHINPSSSGSEAGSNLEIISLNKLSSHLEQLLDSNTDYSDAYIIVEGIEVEIHRCILAARSRFFNELFKREKQSIDKEGKLKYFMNDLLDYGNVGYEAFLIFLSYIYTGKLKASPPEVSTCIDDGCAHDSCRPAINFAIELMYASYVFQVTELASLFQRRLLNFVDKALIEDVIPILVVSSHCNSTQLLTQCIDRVARSDLDFVALEKQLPFQISEDIKSLRKKTRSEYGPEQRANPLLEKRIKRIHKALDSDDVELVRLLLTESNVTLDGANAVHYAAAYCDPKVVTEVLGLGLANVNKRDARGYTVLHVAAMRKEPSIIVSLLTKGACASDLTDDGQSAVSICRRLIRPKDYNSKTKQGQAANKDRICVDVLEREVNRNPMAGDYPESGFLPTVADDLHMKLLYLENRVAFARLFFPTEAKLAMDIAHAETASQFPGTLASNGSRSNLKEVDLNETPGMQNKRLQLKMENLSKTVEMGRRYFPHCSEVLDKFMEDDLPDLFYLDKGTQEEQKIKRMRFLELKADVQKAFNKDKADFHRSHMSTSASSSSLRESLTNKKLKKLC